MEKPKWRIQRTLPMSGAAAQARLTQERKTWRKDHPFGFVAKPETAADGSVNFFVWKCLIPGKKGTEWENGLYPVTLQFSDFYPSKPPLCSFPAGFFHPNVYDSGRVCLSIINDDDSGTWKASINVRQILEGIQTLLTEPNIEDAAQATAYKVYTTNRPKEVARQAHKYKADGATV